MQLLDSVEALALADLEANAILSAELVWILDIELEKEVKRYKYLIYQLCLVVGICEVAQSVAQRVDQVTAVVISAYASEFLGAALDGICQDPCCLSFQYNVVVV